MSDDPAKILPLAETRQLLEKPEAEAILSVANLRQADLIVMGMRDYSGLQEVANRVMR